MNTLAYLERIEQKNEKSQRYILQRAPEVQQFIARLRRFAAHKPESKVAALVTAYADSIQSRLDKVLAK